MILLIAFAFLAGIVTILSPCILPVLPIILSSSVGGVDVGKKRPFGVVVGFIASFTFFTLFLSTIVHVSGISADSLRIVSVFVIAAFGLSLLIPQIQRLVELAFAKLTRFLPQSNSGTGFWSGVIVGLSLGLLWTPCVGPILASVISLAITGTVTLNSFLITFAYSVGTAIPMFAIMIGGQNLLSKAPWLMRNTLKIQKAFGVIMILTAVAIFFNLDRSFQTFILEKFPNYGTGLTKLEDNTQVRQQLNEVGGNKQIKQSDMGKPMFDLLSPKGTYAPEIIPGGQWFNNKPLTLKELRGKVVIIDFWTYSCINCQRTLPYMRAWWQKYKDKGLVIIGVHSPEFEFEKDAGNLNKAIADFGLEYPIVQDNNFDTWRAYNNHYWPAKYFIDKDGFVRYMHFGEGDYDKSEEVIQELLNEAGASDVPTTVDNPSYNVYSKTPETYLGSARTNFLVSLQGTWNVTTEYASAGSGSTLTLNFEAKDVYLVMKPSNGIKSAKVKVYVDGTAQYFGDDNKDGVVTVTEDRLYHLVKLSEPGKHVLKLEFTDGGVDAYAFTFG